MFYTDELDDSYGDEDQNQIMRMIKEHKEDEQIMENNKIASLMVEVDTYRQAVYDAQEALASAEQELDEALSAEYDNVNQ